MATSAVRNLREPASLAQSILNELPRAVGLFDLDGHYLFLNPAGEQFVGKPLAEVQGKSWREVFPEAIGTSFDRAFHEAAVERRKASIDEHDRAHKRWLQVDLMPHEEGVLFLARDVTSARQAQAETRQFQSLVEESDDFVGIVGLDGLGQYINAAGRRLVGLAPDADVSKTAVTEYIHPDSQSVAGAILRRLHETGRGAGEVRFRHLQSGRSIPVQWNLFRLHDPTTGEPSAIATVTRDLTTQKFIESQLRESEQWFRQIAEALPQLVWSARADGFHDYYNQRWHDFMGLGPSESAGEGWFTTFHPEYLPEVRRRWAHSLATGEPFEMEYRRRRHDGLYRWLLGRARPVRDADGNIVRWIGTCTDIDDQKRAEATTRFLAEASNVVSESLDYETTLQKIAKAAVPSFADWSSIDMLQPDGSIKRIAVEHPDPEMVKLAWELTEKYPIDPSSPYGQAKIIREGVSEWAAEIPDAIIDEVVPDPVLRDLIRRLNLRSSLAVPLKARGKTVGVLSLVCSDSGRRYDQADVTIAEDLARRASLSIDNAILHRDIQHAEDRYRSLIEATANITWTTSAVGEMRGQQPGWAQFTGQTFEEYQGDGWSKAIHPEDVDETLTRWQEAIAKQQPFAAEHRLRRHDDVYRLFSVRAVPVLERDGSVREWIGAHSDVTERREAERALARSEARLRRMFNSGLIGILSWDLSGQISGANDKFLEMIGFARDDLRAGRIDWTKLSHPEFKHLDAKAGEELMQTGSHAPYEKPVLLADGRVIHVLIGSALIEGGTEGVSFVLDITEKKKAEEEREKLITELARTNKELDQFAYVASHDLKAPLRGIANLSQWLEEDLGSALPAAGREQLDLLRGRVHRMEALIDGILAYSRAGRVRGTPETVPLESLLKDLVELLSPKTGARVRWSTPLPSLRTEKVPLQQVLMNLIGNALKHARKDDVVVDVACAPTPEGYRFSVTDDGPGIAPEFHDRIWGIFQRLQSRDEVEGTGIGLSIVKKIVESRGGRVWIESSEGAGATFFFTWPVAVRLES